MCADLGAQWASNGTSLAMNLYETLSNTALRINLPETLGFISLRVTERNRQLSSTPPDEGRYLMNDAKGREKQAYQDRHVTVYLRKFISDKSVTKYRLADRVPS